MATIERELADWQVERVKGFIADYMQARHRRVDFAERRALLNEVEPIIRMHIDERSDGLRVGGELIRFANGRKGKNRGIKRGSIPFYQRFVETLGLE